jgi:anti-anti-sigma regulatory factor
MDGAVRYAFQDDTWFIKLLGAVCHPLGPTLNELVNKALLEPGNAKFVIDLSEAETIDSTCLGLLTRLATHPNAVNNPKPIIITGGGTIANALAVVRFDLLFVLVNSATSPIPSQLHAAPQVSSVEQQDILYLLLDAHRRLCAIDAQTNAVFRDVVEAMEADIGTNTT